jgi:hypothetical protein
MATTTLDIIKNALRLIRVLSSGDTPSSESSADAKRTLNQMLDLWTADGIMSYCHLNSILPIVANQYVYSIGDKGGANFDIHRPLKIEQAFIRSDVSSAIVTLSAPSGLTVNWAYEDATHMVFAWTNNTTNATAIRLYRVVQTTELPAPECPSTPTATLGASIAEWQEDNVPNVNRWVYCWVTAVSATGEESTATTAHGDLTYSD